MIDLGINLLRQAGGGGNWLQPDTHAVAAFSGGTITPGVIADLQRRRFALPMNLTAAQILAATPGEIAAAMQACEASDIFDLTRASATTALADGALTSIAANQPAFDDRGLALFSGKTNFVRRSSHTAAHPWGALSHNGITATIAGAGMAGGIPFADFALTGTNTDGWAEPFVAGEHSMTTDCAPGDDFCASLYAQVVSGVWPVGAILAVGVHEDSGSGWLAGSSGGAPPTANPQRIIFSRTISSHAAAVVRSAIIVDGLGTPGATTFTGQRVRLYGWQLEKAPFASPLIQTLGDDIATRASDICKLTPRARALVTRMRCGLVIQAGPIEGGTWGRVIGTDGAPNSDNVLGTHVSDASMFLSGSEATVAGSGGWNAPFGLALGFDETEKTVSANGGDVAASPNGLDFSGNIYLGRGSGGDYANGYYQSLVIYPARPANAALPGKATPHV